MEFGADELWWIPSSEHGFPARERRALSLEAVSPVPRLALHNFEGSSTSNSPSIQHADYTSGGRSSTGFFLGRGLGFAGHVFGLYSTTRSCLVGIEEKKGSRILPFKSSFFRRFLPEVEKSKRPSFRFYLDEQDARAYLKRLKVPEMEVGTVPLHLAFKFFKERPSLFSFVPVKKQVELAKRVLRETRGKAAASQFDGVPIFTSEKLSILVVGPESVRWFRPYFFKKEELDGVIKSSMEHHYQSIIINRRAQRHSQLGDLPSDMGADEDLDLMESQDMQDFMEDNMEEWGPMLESLMAKAAQVHVQDALDRAIFGNKWCRQIAGLQPKFPISVDSFERRAVLDPVAVTNEFEVGESREETAKVKANSLFGKLGLDFWFEKRADAPHLTVVAGIAGSTPDQVMKAATSAIQQAKDSIESNRVPLESLFIADLGGPRLWSNPSQTVPAEP